MFTLQTGPINGSFVCVNVGRSCVFTLPSSGWAQELITRVWRRSQTVCCDVLSHVIKLCSSERLDNTSSFFHLAVCGQMPLNIKWEREQCALVNSEPVFLLLTGIISYLLNHPPAMQILSHTHTHLQHATYWTHIQSSGKFASKPHSRELPDELNASCIMVKYNYFYLVVC